MCAKEVITMIKVTAFSDDKLDELEEQLNSFFSSSSEKFELIDVKYAIAHESVTTDTETGVYSSMKYTALVIYKI